MRKVRHRELKQLGQGHTAGMHAHLKGQDEKPRTDTQGARWLQAESGDQPLGLMAGQWPVALHPFLPSGREMEWLSPTQASGSLASHLFRPLGQGTEGLPCVHSLGQHAHIEHLLGCLGKDAGIYQ